MLTSQKPTSLRLSNQVFALVYLVPLGSYVPVARHTSTGYACNSSMVASTNESMVAATREDNSQDQSVVPGCTPSSTTFGSRSAIIRKATSRSETPNRWTLQLPGRESSCSPDIRISVPGDSPTSTASITT